MRAALRLLLLSATQAPPVNTAAPSIAESSDAVGQTITGTAGTWLNSPTLTYQYQRDGADITGATSLNYTDAHADDGTTTKLLEIPNGNRALAVLSNGIYHKKISVAFATTDTAPFSGNYEGERGYLFSADGNSIMSAASGTLTINGTAAAGTVVVSGDGAGAAQLQARVAGRLFKFRIPSRTTLPNAFGVTGFGTVFSDSNVRIGLRYGGTTAVVARGGANSLFTVTLGSGVHTLLFGMFASGGFVAIQNDSGTPILLWVYPPNDASALYAKHLPVNGSALNYTVNLDQVYDQSTVTDRPGLGNVYSSPVNGARNVGFADGEVQVSFTLPAVTANLVAVTVMFRMVDASNFDYVRIKGNAGGTDWDCTFGKVIATVDTSLTTLASSIGTTVNRVIVKMVSTAFNVWKDTGVADSSVQMGAQQTLSLNNTEVGVGASWDASVTGVQVEAYSRTPAVLSTLF